MKATLLLEDGTTFEGKSFGAYGTNIAEIVFNTSMAGYQEILSDPSYAGQMIVMTYPEIGNYGINADDFESPRPATKGFIVKKYSPVPSHYKSEKSLGDYLKENNVIAIEGVDTRKIVRIIREKGTMKALLTTEPLSDYHYEQLKSFCPNPNIVQTVTRSQIEYKPNNGAKIAFIDYGAKQSIINKLYKKGCDITIFPADISADAILNENFDAVFLSNGPGDPQDVKTGLETIKNLMGKLPIFGICLGYQLLSLAIGANTYKLKYGHRGGNHPIINLLSGNVMMTSQNHSYAVDTLSLPEEAIPTFKNLNDNTLEGFSYPPLNIEAVQFHPEAAAGPEDSNIIFDKWIEKIKKLKEEKDAKK